MPPRRRKAQPSTDLDIQRVPVLKLQDDPNNARVHNERNLDAIEASLKAFGQRKPLVVAQDFTVVAGNGTLAVIRDRLGWDEVWVSVFPGTAEDARAFGIADNRTGELASWDQSQLLATLTSIDTDLLLATGYGADDVDLLRQGQGNPADFLDLTGNSEPLTADGDEVSEHDDPLDGVTSDAEPVGKGELLAIAASTVGEPPDTVEPGQVWRLGRHTLVVADVHKDWPEWQRHLTGDTLFWPYPSLLAPFTKEALTRPVVMVQPNLYLAGWLVTKWRLITGDTPELVPA